MSDNQMELLTIIRENDNPASALMTATLIILGFLKQHESSEEQVVAVPQELC
jgi:hypothetical protein